jgi:cephalosporin hydroxylase
MKRAARYVRTFMQRPLMIEVGALRAEMLRRLGKLEDNSARQLDLIHAMNDRTKRLERTNEGNGPSLLDPDRHPETFLTLEETAQEMRFSRPYLPTYPGFRYYIDDYHFYLGTAPLNPRNQVTIDIGVDGWLFPSDASKLYEMAYFADGPILELGTFRGLSATVIANAMSRSHPDKTLVTIDIDPEHVKNAEEGFRTREVPARERVTFLAADAVVQTAAFANEGKQFAFAFVDHSHSYAHMLPTCRRLAEIIRPGGFVLFHDYNDLRNSRKDHDWGVYQAVRDGLTGFRFYGIYGCTGLFRRDS